MLVIILFKRRENERSSVCFNAVADQGSHAGAELDLQCSCWRVTRRSISESCRTRVSSEWSVTIVCQAPRTSSLGTKWSNSIDAMRSRYPWLAFRAHPKRAIELDLYVDLSNDAQGRKSKIKSFQQTKFLNIWSLRLVRGDDTKSTVCHNQCTTTYSRKQYADMQSAFNLKFVVNSWWDSLCWGCQMLLWSHAWYSKPV